MSAISRREFVLGASASALVGCGSASKPKVSVSGPSASLPTTEGRCATTRRDENEVPVVWLAAGGSYRLEITAAGVAFDVPTRTPEQWSFEELRMGVGHDQIRRFFGQPALARLLDLLRPS